MESMSVVSGSPDAESDNSVSGPSVSARTVVSFVSACFLSFLISGVSAPANIKRKAKSNKNIVDFFLTLSYYAMSS